MELLHLEDIIKVATEYLLNPEDSEKIKAFKEMKNQIIIKRHIPLEQRGVVIEKTLLDIKMLEEASVVEVATAFELSMTFNCLLAYTNIDPDFNIFFKDSSVYDLIWESGIGNLIYDYCKIDYDRLEKQIYQAMSWDNLFTIIESINTLQIGNMDELTSAFKNYTNEINPDTLKKLAEIASFNDPVMKEIKDGLVNSIYKKNQEENQ